MKNFLILIGATISSAFIIAIPILCGLSYGLLWDGDTKFFLTILSFCEFILLIAKIHSDNCDY